MLGVQSDRIRWQDAESFRCRGEVKTVCVRMFRTGWRFQHFMHYLLTTSTERKGLFDRRDWGHFNSSIEAEGQQAVLYKLACPQKQIIILVCPPVWCDCPFHNICVCALVRFTQLLEQNVRVSCIMCAHTHMYLPSASFSCHSCCYFHYALIWTVSYFQCFG